jgi:DNA topoisomerase-3
LQGFRSKMGRPFAAIIKLNAELQPEFDFGQSNDGEGEEVDFSAQESLGTCPKCSAGIFEHGMAYICEKSVGPAKTCDFRSGKIILQQPVERSQMHKLLTTGKTDLLKEFISSRTKRKFSAYLVRGEDGKVGFEFEPRAPKVAKAPAKSAPVAEALADKVIPEAKGKVAAKKAVAKPATKKRVAKK